MNEVGEEVGLDVSVPRASLIFFLFLLFIVEIPLFVYVLYVCDMSEISKDKVWLRAMLLALAWFPAILVGAGWAQATGRRGRILGKIRTCGSGGPEIALGLLGAGFSAYILWWITVSFWRWPRTLEVWGIFSSVAVLLVVLIVTKGFFRRGTVIGFASIGITLSVGVICWWMSRLLRPGIVEIWIPLFGIGGCWLGIVGWRVIMQLIALREIGDRELSQLELDDGRVAGLASRSFGRGAILVSSACVSTVLLIGVVIVMREIATVVDKMLLHLLGILASVVAAGTMALGIYLAGRRRTPEVDVHGR